MKTNLKALTIAMPAFNESERIKTTIQEVWQVAKATLDEFEIIVVDDGSTDNTYALINESKNTLGSEIITLRHQINQGLGAAFKTALDHAHYENITLIVSDGAFRPDGIRNLFLAIGSEPVLLGYRININTRPIIRRILSATLTSYVRFITWTKIKDAHGLFVFPTSLCRRCPIQFTRYSISTQIVSYILHQSTSYKEVPIIYANDADAHSNVLRISTLTDVIFSASKLLFYKIMGKLQLK